MKNYIVSGHGGCQKNHLWLVPDGVEVHFYCDMHRILSNDAGWMVLRKLQKNQEVVPVLRASRILIPYYYCWDNPGCASGVFRRMTKRKVMSLSGTSETEPVALSYIAEVLGNRRAEAGKSTIIHWLACTSLLHSAPARYKTPARL